MRPIDAQQEHDLLNQDRPLKLAPKSELEALLSENARYPSQGCFYDPIADAMERLRDLRERKQSR